MSKFEMNPGLESHENADVIGQLDDKPSAFYQRLSSLSEEESEGLFQEVKSELEKMTDTQEKSEYIDDRIHDMQIFQEYLENQIGMITHSGHDLSEADKSLQEALEVQHARVSALFDRLGSLER